VFGYIGTVSPKVPLAEFVEGWQLAKSQSEELEGARARIHGYLGYYAPPRADMLATINKAKDDGVSYEGPVGKAEIAKAYDEFDVQLLMLGKGRYVTSGKVFEYLATGLPIVSVHDPENAASDVLQGHPLWFPVDDVTPEGPSVATPASASALSAGWPRPGRSKTRSTASPSSVRAVCRSRRSSSRSPIPPKKRRTP